MRSSCFLSSKIWYYSNSSSIFSWTTWTSQIWILRLQFKLPTLWPYSSKSTLKSKTSKNTPNFRTRCEVKTNNSSNLATSINSSTRIFNCLKTCSCSSLKAFNSNYSRTCSTMDTRISLILDNIQLNYRYQTTCNLYRISINTCHKVVSRVVG